MLADLIHCLRKVVLWTVLTGILVSVSLQVSGMQVSDLISDETITIEQPLDDPSTSRCNGQCLVDSMLCKVNACASEHPLKIAFIGKARSVIWPIIPLALTGRSTSIEPKPPKRA